jgi:molybdenum cofactor cytidylyltransferase
MVVHPDDRELAEAARRYGADVVAPDLPPPDMKASVCHALRYIEQNFVPQNGDGWLLAPADMPILTTATINRMIDHVLASTSESTPAIDRIFIPTHHGKRGHPVVFPWSFAAEAFQLAENEGLNALVARHSVIEVPLSDVEVLEDLDHPDDYRRLHDHYHRYTPPPDTPT